MESALRSNTLGQDAALSFFLEELFGRAVDRVTIESLGPYIGLHILKEVEYVSIGA
jgi:uncharacterized protein